jgi:hypothetical protein
MQCPTHNRARQQKVEGHAGDEGCAALRGGRSIHSIPFPWLVCAILARSLARPASPSLQLLFLAHPRTAVEERG